MNFRLDLYPIYPPMYKIYKFGSVLPPTQIAILVFPTDFIPYIGNSIPLSPPNLVILIIANEESIKFSAAPELNSSLLICIRFWLIQFQKLYIDLIFNTVPKCTYVCICFSNMLQTSMQHANILLHNLYMLVYKIILFVCQLQPRFYLYFQLRIICVSLSPNNACWSQPDTQSHKI